MSRLKASEKVNYNIGGTTFTIDRKYTDLKLIGKGSYGVVCSALDISDERKVGLCNQFSFKIYCLRLDLLYHMSINLSYIFN
jgi:hypothetical protein